MAADRDDAVDVSVVIATYNRRDVLGTTLPAVLAQDLPGRTYEVVVVDDGSHDGTVEFVRALSSRGRLKLLEESHRGTAAARNAGIKAATGRVVLVLDDDIVCTPDLLERHLSCHDGAEASVVVGPTLTAGRPGDGLADEWMSESLETYFSRRRDEPAPKWPESAWFGPNCSTRRETLLALGGYDERETATRLEDIELGLRLWQAGLRFRFEPRALVRHLPHKSLRRVVVDDARSEGRTMVRLCRKHPEYRPHSPLATLSAGSLAKRSARQALVRLPGPVDPTLAALVSLLQRMPRALTRRATRLRLIQAARQIVLLRAALREAGSWRQLQGEFGARIPVLLYHRVGPERDGVYPSLTVSPAAFRRQVGWLRRRGFQTVSLGEWQAWRREGRALPARPVVITFDDAYDEIAQHALPILREHGFGAVVFAVTGQLGGTNAWDEAQGFAALRLMSAEQMREWVGHGIEFGAHTRTHADLRGLDPRRLDDEIRGSRRDLEQRLGAPVLSFAYPFGNYDDAARAAALSSFELVFSCDEGLNDLGTAPDLILRTMIQPVDTLVDLELRLRLGWSPLQSVREIVRLKSRVRYLRRRLAWTRA